MILRNVTELVREFANKVVYESKFNAQKQAVSGNLLNSISSKITPPNITTKDRQFLIQFFMEAYGKFQDAGVKGVKEGESQGKKLYGKEFKYTSKGGKRGLKGMPPTGALDRWTVRKKGFTSKVRDDKGRFIERKTLVFLVARNIFFKGIKPTLFFTKPFTKYFAELPEQLAVAYGDEFEARVKILYEKNQ
jgi:hypothetical protein|tara:strand:+ start:40 stop:612 length:573 start_codon:yes stop_codon:yes gene_type:complete